MSDKTLAERIEALPDDDIDAEVIYESAYHDAVEFNVQSLKLLVAENKALLTRAVEAEAKVAEWTRVEDGWPALGQLVVMRRDCGDSFPMHLVTWTEEEERYAGPRWNNVTHWMPIPPYAPKGESE